MAPPKNAPKKLRRLVADLSPAALIDRKLDIEWKAAARTIAGEGVVESAHWDAKWEAVDRVLTHDPPLYLAGGFKTVKAFCAKHLPGVHLQTVRDSTRVARHFTAAHEAAHGVTSLAALLDYLEAVNGELPRVAIDPARTRVVVRRGRANETVLFPTLTTDEMRAAARAKRPKRRSAAQPADPTARAIVAALTKARLPALAPTRRRATNLFPPVADADLARFGKALAAIKLP